MDSFIVLKEGLARLGIDYSQSQFEMLKQYISEIELWNNKYKLVAAVGEQLVTRHILDSLSAVSDLNKLVFNSAADAGSGAGLPGIPLAIFFTDVTFTLIERSGRRVGFLRNIMSLLGWGERVKIIEKDVEEVSDKFDLVLFRAFRNLPDYYKILENITSPGGVMFAYKGKRKNVNLEISALGEGVNVDIKPVTVPFLDEERNFCIFRF